MNEIQETNFRNCLDQLEEFIKTVEEGGDKKLKNAINAAKKNLSRLEILVKHLDMLEFHLDKVSEIFYISPVGCSKILRASSTATPIP